MDNRTILVSVILFLCVVLLVSGFLLRHAAGWKVPTRFWFLGCLSIVVGAILVLTRALLSIHPLISIGLANFFLLTGYLLHVEGLTRFLRGGKTSGPLWALNIAGALLIVYYAVVQVSDLARSIPFAAVHLIFIFRTLWLIRSVRNTPIAPHTRLVAWFQLIAIPIFVGWGTRILWSTPSITTTSLGNASVAIFFLALTLVYLGLTFSELILLHGALLLKQKEEAEKAMEAMVALDEYQALQAQLIAHERDASLGRLVASVSHGLNTPLAAVESAVQSLEVSLGADAAAGYREFQGWTDADQKLLLDLLGRFDPRSVPKDTVEERRRRRALEPWLGDRADAGLLVACGWDLDRGKLETLFQSPVAGRILAFARRAIEARTLAGTAKEAGRRAVAVVQSLQQWFQSTDDGTRDTLLVSSFQTVLEEFQREQAGVAIELDSQGERRVSVPSYGLGLVWNHILTNAAEALRGQGTIEVSIRDVPDQKVEVEISDQGPGVPEALQPFLFQPFVGAMGSGRGVGLGLFLSRKFLEDWGGTLRFDRVSGKTSFVASLPLS